MMAAEQWRVGRHVPHHIYRSDGNTVADEVAVTHRPEDAAQIVAEHKQVRRFRAALLKIRRYATVDPASEDYSLTLFLVEQEVLRALAESSDAPPPA